MSGWSVLLSRLWFPCLPLRCGSGGWDNLTCDLLAGKFLRELPRSTSKMGDSEAFGTNPSTVNGLISAPYPPNYDSLAGQPLFHLHVGCPDGPPYYRIYTNITLTGHKGRYPLDSATFHHPPTTH